jgi:hypothetical protein
MLFAVFLLLKTAFTDPGIIPRKDEQNAEHQVIATGTDMNAINLQTSLEIQGRNALPI